MALSSQIREHQSTYISRKSIGSHVHQRTIDYEENGRKQGFNRSNLPCADLSILSEDMDYTPLKNIENYIPQHTI